MKILVRVSIPASKEAPSSLELLAEESDTVLSVKERLSALQLVLFPDQELFLCEKALPDDQQLTDCGIKEPGPWSLDFVVKASEASLEAQLTDLLKARDLSCDELGLLYCYKHGVSFSQALQLVGRGGERLTDFVKTSKAFQVQGGRVALVRQSTALKPFSVADELESILQECGPMELKDLCAKFEEKFDSSLAFVLRAKPIDFLLKESNRFVVVDRRHVSLRSAAATAGSPQSPAAAWSRRGAAAVPAPPPGLNGKAPSSPAASAAENQRYLDLHQSILDRAGQTHAQQVLTDVINLVQGTSFLNVAHVAKGGSLAKGTAVAGGIDAEAVFFLPGLPHVSQERWLPPLVKSVAAVLREKLTQDSFVSSIDVHEDGLTVHTKGMDVPVTVRFSPVFGSYQETVKALAAQGANARRFYTAALVEERVQFIARQPASVKVTARLLKWWRDRQAWSNERSRPSDDMLELIAVYSASQSKPSDQHAAVANVMALLARFSDLRVVWSNYYTKGEIWPPLLQQRPLLMDPLNPYVNLADLSVFDAAELEERARIARFF